MRGVPAAVLVAVLVAGSVAGCSSGGGTSAPAPARSTTPQGLSSGTAQPASGSTAPGTAGAPATPTGSATAAATAAATASVSGPASAAASGSPRGNASGTASAPGTSAPGRTATSRPPVAAGRWKPGPGLTWQWQLTGTIDTSVDVDVYDLDAVTTPAATVKTLHAKGIRVICYVNVGAWEDFRADRGAFPAAVLGASNGWPGERWLDVRRLDVLRPIMAARLDTCRSKGFDAVEPDNVDGWSNDSGFPLTAAHQLAYNRMIAGLAHDRGLAVGLKNDLEQAPDLVRDFDFAVLEQCVENSECADARPFLAAGKAVLDAEYTGTIGGICSATTALRVSAILKRQALDAWRQAC